MMSLEILYWVLDGLKRHWKVWLMLVCAALAAFAVWIYGARRYDAGHRAATDKIRAEQQAAVASAERAAREKEQAAQAAFDEERKIWNDEKLKMQSSISDLRSNADRLQRVISLNKFGGRASAKQASTAAGIDPDAQAAWVVLGECVREYETLATDADDLNSRLSIGQKWVKSLPE